jgi:hypothetical protein
VGFQKSATCVEQQVSRCPFVLVDQSTRDRATLDLFVAEVRHGVGRSGRATFAGAVRAWTVVVPDVFREYQTSVPLTNDQYPVGDFSCNRADEPFGACGQRGGILTTRMPTSARTASKDVVN